MLILPSHLKIQVDKFTQFFFGHLFPSDHRVVVGIVVSHQFYGMLHRDFMLFHEVSDLWVRLDFLSVRGFPPGKVFSLWWGSSFSSFSRVLLQYEDQTVTFGPGRDERRLRGLSGFLENT